MPVWQKALDEQPRLAARKRMALDSRMEVLKHCPQIGSYAQKKKHVKTQAAKLLNAEVIE
jgi:hypothetical protein